MHANGSGQTRVTLTRSDVDITVVGESPTWKPDGSKLAFSFRDHCGDGGTFTVSAAGGEVHRVGCGDKDTAWAPLAPPETRWIAYAAVDENFGGEHIYRIAMADDEVLFGVDRLTPEGYYESPSWAPDSSKIAFSSDQSEILTMNPDGTNIVVVGSGRRPAWSPDGDKFAFESFEGVTVRYRR
jgi:Tol biopolymer transport system component